MGGWGNFVRGYGDSNKASALPRGWGCWLAKAARVEFFFLSVLGISCVGQTGVQIFDTPCCL